MIMRSRFALPSLHPAFVVLTALLAIPLSLSAQSAGASEEKTDSTVSQQMAALTPGAWGIDGTVGFRLQDGRTETLGADLDLILYKVTAGGTLIRFDGELTRAEFRPAPGASRITVEDSKFASVTLVPRVAGIRLLGTGFYSRDVPVGLSHRVMAQFGPYLELGSGRIHFSIAPVLGVGSQENVEATEAETITNFGVIQSMVWHPTNTSTFETWVAAHRDFDVSDDYSVTANTSLAAKVSAHLGLKIYYKYQLEGIHPAAAGSDQHTVGAGLNITFPGR